MQPDTLVLINSNNHLEGLGLGVLLPPSPTPAKRLGYCLNQLPKRKVARTWLPQLLFDPPLGFPLPLSLHCPASEPFMYTSPLQKPERPDSLYGWARGSEWRCPHSLCRVRAPFQKRITMCLPYSSDPSVRCLWFPSHLPPTVILLDCRIKVSHSPLDTIYSSQLSMI